MKGLCEVRAKPHSVLKNQMTFLHFGRWTPQDETWGQVDIWSDGLPI